MSITKSLVEIRHDTGYGELLLSHINDAIRGKDMVADRVVPTPVLATQKQEPLKTVWLVGGRNNTPFCDVYANREDAVEVVIGYIFKDPGWWVRLSTKQQKILFKLKDDPDLAIEFYNSVANDEVKWYIYEKPVRYCKPKIGER